MKVVAIVKELCEVISGTSDNGNDWEKQMIVVETCDIEPKTLAIEFMGIRRVKGTKTLQVGDRVEVTFGIRCNEYQGKWYTRLDGTGCTLLERTHREEVVKEEEPAAPAPTQTELEMPPSGENEMPPENDLPF